MVLRGQDQEVSPVKKWPLPPSLSLIPAGGSDKPGWSHPPLWQELTGRGESGQESKT